MDSSAPVVDMPPAPPPPPPRRDGRRAVLVGVLIALAGGLLAAWTVGVVPCESLQAQPSCNVALLPGPAKAVDDLVEVDAPETFGSEGELVLTTIVVDSGLDLFEYVSGRLDDDVDVVPRGIIYPDGQTVQDARVENEILMSDSQLSAKVAALEWLGVDLDDLTAGAEVVAVLPDTPAEDAALDAGDVITEVDGDPVGNADEAVAAIGLAGPGDEVVLTLQHAADDAEAEGDVTIELDANPDDPARPYVGVLLRDYQVLPYDIDIEAGAIGGPSAGLVFSLGIVDRLTEEDLTGGQVIAGTGTITEDGDVGPIGGIVQKIAGAAGRDDPAVAFLVPRGNWELALTAAPPRDVVIVPIETLDQAVTALQDLAADRTPAGAVVVGPRGMQPADDQG